MDSAAPTPDLLTLAQWLEREGISDAEFGRRCKRARSTVTRWKEGLRLPGKDDMPVIVRETRGEVMPNSFYDLPDAPGQKGKAA